MRKKVGILFLAFLLIFSNFALSSAAAIQSLSGQNLTKGNLSDELTGTEDPEQEVRVVVEMEEEAPIEIATKRGITYKTLKETEKQQLEKKAKAQQQEVKKEMKAKKLDARVLQEFTTVVNGFSVEVKQKDIEEIEQLKGVKTVHIVNEYERPEVKPDMKYSKDLVEAQQAWRDYGYKGEGFVVGVIDTGIDPTHQDMILSEGNEAALSEEFVNQQINEEDLPGQFYSEKVPYGYNYMDENDEIREIHAGANYHGMHVAGTVGANGDEENGGIKGIAPEAQLLALKVFGNDPEMQSTYGDIYIKAIDDAIKLGADALNMSLGSPAGFVNAESPEQIAVARAVDNGILMSISAGNSALFADGYFHPYTSNPDYGVTGSPGVSYESLQVASFENTYMEVDGLDYEIDGEPGMSGFLSAGNVHPNDVDEKTFDLVDAGLGLPEDFEGIDVEGKYALIQRGGNPFTEKALNAQQAGAVGAIIYNNTDGIVNMATDPAITIPQLFMLKSNGDQLAQALQDGQAVSITFNGETTQMENPSAGQMSAFTSWGLTPNLDFKPEITAPGGQILSTLNDNEYGLMSGTSMAAPHVAGGGALVLQRVDEEFGYENANRVHLAKNFMMNTSEKVEFEGEYVSPRRQGAGMMQLHAALSTPVVVTESETDEAKVALKEINENEISFELTAENVTDTAVSYDVEANVQTDTPADGGGVLVNAPNLFPATDLGELATINGEATNTIEIPANGEETFTVTIDLSSVDADLNEIYTNGYWLEGFVTLTDPTDTNPELSVPYVGFKGEWDQAPIFDSPLWEDDTFYEMTGVLTDLGGGSYGFLGEDLATGEIDPEKIAFSPDGDGTQDNALMVLSFLRNAKDAKFTVRDEGGKVVRTIRMERELRKNYYDGGRAPYYSLSSARAWDGKVNGKLAEEGQYYLSVDAAIDYEDAERQTLDLPVILDLTEPELAATIHPEDHVITVDVTDELSGVASWDVLVDGESVLEAPYVNGETEHTLSEELGEEQTVTIVATDYAGNSAEVEPEEIVPDTTVPDLRLQTPEFLGVEGSRDVEFTGYVTDESGVAQVTIDGEEVELEYNEEEDRYYFSKVITKAKDGYFTSKITAVDNAGNDTEIARRYFVDSEAATISVKAPEKTKKDTVTVKAHVKDNFDQIDLFVNGNHVYMNELSEPYGKKKFKEKIEVDLDLEEGENVFEFKVVDLAGNETVEEIVIEKKPGKGDGGDDNDDDDHGDKYSWLEKIFGGIKNIISIIWSLFG